MKDKSLTALYAVAIFFLIITFCISLPIYFRPLYYAQIEPLGLCEQTGKDVATIRAAYDEVMDYLTVPGASFGTGVFEHTKRGASHFADCRDLFRLNGTVLVGSFAIVLILYILQRKHVVTLKRPFGMHVSFLSAALALTIFALIGICVLWDFDATFEVFHRVCFPGKANWAFHPKRDAIVQILPPAFFMSCAILMIGALVCICATVITVQLIRRHKNIAK